ncbi:MAG: hypothetical protein M1831_001959 [Alyxoria varia]|nr:MAG: hypothetical protein M1831_001959 [Alyxoria varia]
MPLNYGPRSPATRLEHDAEQPKTVEEYRRQEQLVTKCMSNNYAVVDRSALLENCSICYEILMRPHADLCTSLQEYRNTRHHHPMLQEALPLQLPGKMGGSESQSAWTGGLPKLPCTDRCAQNLYNEDLKAGRISSTSGNGQEKKQTAVQMVEREYEVAEILDIRSVRGELEVQAKWKGCEEDTAWYPIDNFKKAPLLLANYYCHDLRHPQPSWLGEELIKFIEM